MRSRWPISNFPCSLTRNQHHTVWRTWLFIAHCDERWLNHQFSPHHLYISFYETWLSVTSTHPGGLAGGHFLENTGREVPMLCGNCASCGFSPASSASSSASGRTVTRPKRSARKSGIKHEVWTAAVTRKVSSLPRSFLYLTLSLPRMINFKFPLRPHQKYNITQYEELGFS